MPLPEDFWDDGPAPPPPPPPEETPEQKRQRLIHEMISTPAGRQKLAASMAEPLRARLREAGWKRLHEPVFIEPSFVTTPAIEPPFAEGCTKHLVKETP